MNWTKEQVDRALTEVVNRSRRDPAFRQLCLQAPEAAVAQLTSQPLPPGFKLRFVDNNHADLTVVLPDPFATVSSELSDSELASVSGGVGGPTCFADGTPILLADGTSRAIEAMKVGDQVLAYDERLGRVDLCSVENVLVHDDEPLSRATVEGMPNDLVLTDNHPFYVEGCWRAIRDIPPRSALFHFDPVAGEPARRRLVSLRPAARRGRVYNIEVARAHTYFVGGVLVHNGSVIRGVDGHESFVLK